MFELAKLRLSIAVLVIRLLGAAQFQLFGVINLFAGDLVSRETH